MPERDGFKESAASRMHSQEMTENQSTIPDGGTIAWMQCVGSFFLLFNSFGIVNAYGVFQTYYKQQLIPDQSNAQIAWIGSLQAFLNIFLGVVAGPIYDRGHLRPLLAVGTLLMVLGLITTGLCRNYWELILAQGVLVGAGAGLLFLPSIAILSQYFRLHLSLATGLSSSGSAVGSICYPILFNRLQPRIGFRNTVWIIALISLVTLLAALVCIRLRFKPEKIREIYDLDALREKPFLLWAAYLFTSLLGLYTPSFYIQQYAATVMSRDLAFYTLPILNAGSLFGRIVRFARFISSVAPPFPVHFVLMMTLSQIPLYAADIWGPLNVEIPFTLCAGVLALSWLAIRDTGGVVVFSAIYGFFAGAITTLTAPIDVALSPRVEVVGVRMGMLLVPWSLGLLVGTPVAGVILGSSSYWTGLKTFCGTVLLIATGFCVATRVSKNGARLARC